MRAIALAALVALGLGCSIPEGRFTCATSAECPSGFVCRGSDGRCWRTDDGDDAHASLDAGSDAGGSVDAAHDAPPIDAPGDDAPDAGVDGCPIVRVDGECVGAISAGFSSCAIRPDGSVRCWGYHGDEQALGTTATITTTCADGSGRLCSAVPVLVDGIASATSLGSGEATNCAIEGNRVYCWGQDPMSGLPAPTARRVTLPSGFLQPDEVEVRFAIAVRNGSSVAIGGFDQQGTGLLLDGFTGTGHRGALASVMPAGAEAIVDVGMGWYHGCVVGADTTWCWGKNTHGESDATTPSAGPMATPHRIPVSEAVEVTAGDGFGCARIANGQVHCWGWNDRGQLGQGTVSAFGDATIGVVGLTDARELVSGFSFSCARRASGQVVCWGSSNSGQVPGDLRDCNGNCATSPVEVPGLADAIDIAAGASHACALRATGAILCWGSNVLGQLGDGSFSGHGPVVVAGLTP